VSSNTHERSSAGSTKGAVAGGKDSGTLVIVQNILRFFCAPVGREGLQKGQRWVDFCQLNEAVFPHGRRADRSGGETGGRSGGKADILTGIVHC
jgi:hypothetical protein